MTACHGKAETGNEIDWDYWLHRVDVEHDVTGIFPEIYAQWEAQPQKALAILKIKPRIPDCWQCGPKLYQSNVSVEQIIQFLLAQQAVDDDIRRYALEETAGAFVRRRF